jgi:hypothetical protein
LALADHEGLSSDGDVEYFIRILEDRPPDVRVLKPASDRSVTRLEEVEIDAQAEDDYGIDRLDLVYSIRGEAEKTISLKIPRGETTVAGHHTLFLEDMEVQPGDFVSYYLRARDLTRGTRPNEARSDIFFLEIKPYEQEFSLAQSQASAAGGAGGRGSIDELAAAQKEIIVATWKLDRRAQLTKGAKSEQDVKSVARAEAELKTRVESASSGFRETAMRDPRRRFAAAARTRRRAAAAVDRAASRRPDDGGRGCDDGGGRSDGPCGCRTGRAENRRRACAGDGSAQLPVEGARRSQKTRCSAAAGRQWQRQQSQQLRRVVTVRQGTAETAADQLRDPFDRRAERRSESKRARQDPRSGAAAGRAAQEATGTCEKPRGDERRRIEARAREIDARAVRPAAAGRTNRERTRFAGF